MKNLYYILIFLTCIIAVIGLLGWSYYLCSLSSDSCILLESEVSRVGEGLVIPQKLYYWKPFSFHAIRTFPMVGLEQHVICDGRVVWEWMGQSDGRLLPSEKGGDIRRVDLKILEEKHGADAVRWRTLEYGALGLIYLGDPASPDWSADMLLLPREYQLKPLGMQLADGEELVEYEQSTQELPKLRVWFSKTDSLVRRLDNYFAPDYVMRHQVTRIVMDPPEARDRGRWLTPPPAKEIRDVTDDWSKGITARFSPDPKN